MGYNSNFNKQKAVRALLALAVFLGALWTAMPAPAQDDGISVRGHLQTKYRFRATDDESDGDIYQYLGLDVGDPLKNRVTLHLYARATADTDGVADHEEYSPFHDIYDSYGDGVHAQLFSAYADVHRVKGMSMLRFGRQLMYETPEVLYFDGARVETAENKNLLHLKLGAYGGVPTHLYERDQEGNALYGAFAQTRPWPGARVAFHWTHTENDYIFDEYSDDLFGLGWWQSISRYFRFSAMYTLLDDEPRDLRANATLLVPEYDFMISGHYFELLTEHDDYSLEFDPFYASLHTYYPYWQGGFLVYKGLGENFGIEGGLDGRQLKEEDDEGLFNHEWLRYYGTIYGKDLGIEGLDASFTGEQWESYSKDDLITSYGGEVSLETSRRFKVTAGSDYALYRYDYYLDTEDEEVQTYYGGLMVRPVSPLRFDLRYRYEDGEFDDYQWYEISAKYEFGKTNED